MRIPKSWIPSLSKRIVDNLLAKELIDPSVSKDALIEQTGHLLMEELMVEDRLHEEIREMLKKHEQEIAKGKLDYRKLFDMTKQKLVKERNIIL
ncbi:MAG: DUF507 family protein [Nitrospirae bacterium]|nr:MAG: DUF507 family protein [Nitrospirota bacterium]